FAAVATDLHTGQEVWLKEGSTTDAVRASIALPGLFSPVWNEGRLLVDGGLVNPVPVTLARAMGADIVLAVDLNADILGRHLEAAAPQRIGSTVGSAWRQHLPEALSALLPTGNQDERMPSLIDIVASSINIMQVRITRSRMAGDPADVVIAPPLATLGLLDFHKADQAIDAGLQAVQASLPALQGLAWQPESLFCRYRLLTTGSHELGRRHAHVALEHGRESTLVLVAQIERHIEHGLALRQPLDCSEQPDVLTPLHERHAQFLHEQAIQRTRVTPESLGPFMKRRIVVEMLLNMCAQTHQARTARGLQLCHALAVVPELFKQRRDQHLGPTVGHRAADHGRFGNQLPHE